MKMKENRIIGIVCRITVTALASVFIAGSNVRVNVALAAEGGHKNTVSQMISSRAVDLKTSMVEDEPIEAETTKAEEIETEPETETECVAESEEAETHPSLVEETDLMSAQPKPGTIKAFENLTREQVIMFISLGFIAGVLAGGIMIGFIQPFIAYRRSTRFFVKGMLTGKARGMSVNISASIGSENVMNDRDGNFSFKRLLVNNPYEITVTDHDNVVRARVQAIMRNKESYCEVLETDGINVKAVAIKNGVHMDIY